MRSSPHVARLMPPVCEDVTDRSELRAQGDAQNVTSRSQRRDANEVATLD